MEVVELLESDDELDDDDDVEVPFVLVDDDEPDESDDLVELLPLDFEDELLSEPVPPLRA